MTLDAHFIHPSDELVRLPRRGFLGAILGAASAAAWPASLSASPRPGADLERLARASGGAPDEAFWAIVRDQFPLRPGLILMNSANLCPAPYQVIDAVHEWTRVVDEDATFQNRSRFADLEREALAALSDYVGAAPDEIVVTRNTTEGNNVVAHGLDLGSGDEVLLWDQNHPSNSGSWDVGARRHGYTVTRVATPVDAGGPEALLGAFAAAMSPRTRVLSFSHHSNTSGVALPAAELCRLARERGILTHIDGAQTFGWLRLDLHAIGCDFFAASSHKWLMGPKETGILYVRRESAERLWPLVVGVGWESALEDGGAGRYRTLGQRDDAAVASMGRAVAFHRALGPERVEARVRELVRTLRTRIAARVAGVRFHTPRQEAFSGGVLVFELPGVDPRRAFQTLYEEHGVGCAARTGAFPGLRLCPHVYNTLEDAERVCDAVAALTA